MNIDPLSDKYESVSPYNFVLNNPIIHTDPDGRSVDGEFELIGGEWKKTSTKGTTDFGKTSKTTGTRVTIDGDGNVIGN
jgi:hypothetical protein